MPKKARKQKPIRHGVALRDDANAKKARLETKLKLPEEKTVDQVRQEHKPSSIQEFKQVDEVTVETKLRKDSIYIVVSSKDFKIVRHSISQPDVHIIQTDPPNTEYKCVDLGSFHQSQIKWFRCGSIQFSVQCQSAMQYVLFSENPIELFPLTLGVSWQLFSSLDCVIISEKLNSKYISLITHATIQYVKSFMELVFLLKFALK